MIHKDSTKGMSMVEMMIVVAIATVIFAALVMFFSKNTPFYNRIQARQQLMTGSRMTMDTIIDRLRNGKARTMSISTPNLPIIVPNSRIDFVLQTPLPSGATAYAIYLTSNTIFTQEYPPAGGGPPHMVTTGVTGLMFTGSSQDPGILGVTLQMNVAWDASGDPTHTSSILLPNQTVHMVETP